MDDDGCWYGVPIPECLSMAQRIARATWWQHHRWCDLSDYESAAYEGVGRAVVEYPTITTLPFRPFCGLRVRHAIIDYWRTAHGRHNTSPKGWRHFELPGYDLAHVTAPT